MLEVITFIAISFFGLIPNTALAQGIPEDFDPTELELIRRARIQGIPSRSAPAAGAARTLPRLGTVGTIDHRRFRLTPPTVTRTPDQLQWRHFNVEGIIDTIHANWADIERFFQAEGTLTSRSTPYEALPAPGPHSCTEGRAVTKFIPCLDPGTVIDGVPVEEGDPRVRDPRDEIETSAVFTVHASLAEYFNYGWEAAGAYVLFAPRTVEMDGETLVERRLVLRRTLTTWGYPYTDIREYHRAGTTEFSYSTFEYSHIVTYPGDTLYNTRIGLSKPTPTTTSGLLKVSYSTMRPRIDYNFGPWTTADSLAIRCLMLYATKTVRTANHPVLRNIFDLFGYVSDARLRDQIGFDVSTRPYRVVNRQSLFSCTLPWADASY